MNEKNCKNKNKKGVDFYRLCKSYNVEILKIFTLELNLRDTESATKNNLLDLQTELKGFKFMTTLFSKFKKIQTDDKTLYSTFYSHSKTAVVINENNIGEVFKSVYIIVISNIQKSVEQGSDWIIDSVIIITFQSIILWLVTVIWNYQKN